MGGRCRYSHAAGTRRPARGHLRPAGLPVPAPPVGPAGRARRARRPRRAAGDRFARPTPAGWAPRRSWSSPRRQPAGPGQPARAADVPGGRTRRARAPRRRIRRAGTGAHGPRPPAADRRGPGPGPGPLPTTTRRSSAQSAMGAARRALDEVLRFDPGVEAGPASARRRRSPGRRGHGPDAAPPGQPRPGPRPRDARSPTGSRRCGKGPASIAARPDELPALRERLQRGAGALSPPARSRWTGSRQTVRRRAHGTEAPRAGRGLDGRAPGRRGQLAERRGHRATWPPSAWRAADSRSASCPLGRRQHRRQGADEVEFLVTANAGQPPAPMSRVASGGELSRLNLAIQVVATATRGRANPGVRRSGCRGRRCRGRDRGPAPARTQQPAGRCCASRTCPRSPRSRRTRRRSARRHERGKTTTAVRMLTADERVEETARMLGGVKITEQTRAHAAEMLAAGRTAPAARDPRERRHGSAGPEERGLTRC